MSFTPNWVTSPGNTILDILEEKNISVPQFSKTIGEDTKSVNELLSGNRRIENSLASKLAASLGFSREFWIKRDEIYFQRYAELEGEWLRKLPITEMKKRGLIEKGISVQEACLRFFGIDSVFDWNVKYRGQMDSLAFRKSKSFETDLFSIAVWVRQAELLTKNYPVAKWNQKLFEEKLLTEIKPLSKTKNPKEFLPKLIKICANCGVKLAIVPSIGKNRASGATKFVNDSALMILSFRYLTDDHFWFTFFHEAGHLVLHSETRKFRIDTDVQGATDDEEIEANSFAEHCLIPLDMQQELEGLNSNKRRLIGFASRAGISPGIVVGQMQFKNVISYSYLNSYKRKYTWDDIYSGLKDVVF